VSISDDASLLAGSFDDSLIRIWTLTPKKLLPMKPPSQLATIPLSAGNEIVDDIISRFVYIPRGYHGQDTRWQVISMGTSLQYTDCRLLILA